MDKNSITDVGVYSNFRIEIKNVKKIKKIILFNKLRNIWSFLKKMTDMKSIEFQ